MTMTRTTGAFDMSITIPDQKLFVTDNSLTDDEEVSDDEWSLFEEEPAAKCPAPQQGMKKFWDLSIPWSDPQIIQTIVDKWKLVHRLVANLASGNRLHFWKMMLENRRLLPRQQLLQIWYDNLNDRGDLNYQRFVTQNKVKEYTANVSNPDQQKAAVITDPLLIDDPIVCFRYCQAQKTGWQMFQYIHGRRHQTLKLPEAMRQAIRDDCCPVFAIHLDMTGKRITYSLLVDILESNAVGIFRSLLENKLITDAIIPLPELCCLLVTRFPDEISIPMLTVLDELNPGLIVSVKDEFGRNLLWYAVHNMKTGWFHPDCQLTPYLLAHGCDPQNVNQLGLSWQTVTDNLSFGRKKFMMSRRYRISDKIQTSRTLRQTQPLGHL